MGLAVDNLSFCNTAEQVYNANNNLMSKINDHFKDKNDIAIANRQIESNLVDENLNRDYVRTGMLSSDTYYIGTINGKPTSLKKGVEKNGFFSSTTTYNGKFDDKDVDLHIISEYGKDPKFVGTIGDKNIDITFPRTPMFPSFHSEHKLMYGQIGDKEIDINVGDSVNVLNGEQDNLTLLASLLHSKFTVVNGGELDYFGLSNIGQQIQNQRMMNDMAAATMSNF